MKKFFALLLTLALLLSTLSLIACDEKDDGTDDPEETTASPEEDDKKPSKKHEEEKKDKPVVVSSLKGMNARGLLEKCMDDVKDTTFLDMQIESSTLRDGLTTTVAIQYTASEDEIYFMIDEDGEAMSVWMLDEGMFLDLYGTKYRSQDVSIDSVLGEGFWDIFRSELPTEMPEIYLKKAEKATIYFYKDLYYFTLSFNEQEAKELDEENAFTETLYFRSSGHLVLIETKEYNTTTTASINYYGSFDIAPPEDADSFIELLP